MDPKTAFAEVEKNEDYIVDILQKIIAVDTSIPPGENYGKLIDIVEPEFQRFGLETERVFVPEDKVKQMPWDLKGERVNLVATLNEGETAYLTSYKDYRISVTATQTVADSIGTILTPTDALQNDTILITEDNTHIFDYNGTGVIDEDTGGRVSMAILIRNIMSKCLLAVKDELHRAKVAVIEPLDKQIAPDDEEETGDDGE